MNALNNLQSLLDFYDKNLRGARPYQSPTMDRANMNDSGEQRPGLLWAQSMLGQMGGGEGQASPDFFGGAQAPTNALAAYRQPAAFDPNDPATMPSQRQQQRRGIPNYLAQLLGGR